MIRLYVVEKMHGKFPSLSTVNIYGGMFSSIIFQLKWPKLSSIDVVFPGVSLTDPIFSSWSIDTAGPVFDDTKGPITFTLLGLCLFLMSLNFENSFLFLKLHLKDLYERYWIRTNFYQSLVFHHYQQLI